MPKTPDPTKAKPGNAPQPEHRPPLDPASGVRRIKLAPHQTTDAVTATDDLFVLAHLGIPRVDPARWSLRLDGLIGRERSFSLAELKARPKRVVEAVHQCCGSPMEPKVPTRRVANLRWGGVDLAALLDELGVDPGASFLWSFGLDGGPFAGRHCDGFLKDMPLSRLAAGDVLLAYELNGAPLPAEHGFPLRLVVPGYYGTNSVKWLWRLHLAAERATGLFVSELYNDPVDAEEIAAGAPSRRPVWAVAPEAIIVTPAPDAVVPADTPVPIEGWAWSFRAVAAVELTADDGASFLRAELEPRRGWRWQRFSCLWQPPAPGEWRLRARASEAGGVTQPLDGARNAQHSVTIRVR
ncbi:molybdopterin-dependent oxidoreductase [Bosea thiooxidans]